MAILYSLLKVECTKILFLSTMLDRVFLIGFHDEFTRRTQNVTILKIRIHQRGNKTWDITTDQI